jgi:hypothetical protein
MWLACSSNGSASLGGDTDTSRDYEYTDWDAVVNFARTFADGLAEPGVKTGSES